MGSPAVDMIERLKRLPHDWDSYGADAPDERTVARALDCLSNVVNTLGDQYAMPAVAPIADPGVSLTWRDRYHRGDVKVLVTPATIEWVLLKNRHIVDHGAIADAQQFRQFAHGILSGVTL